VFSVSKAVARLIAEQVIRPEPDQQAGGGTNCDQPATAETPLPELAQPLPMNHYCGGAGVTAGEAVHTALHQIQLTARHGPQAIQASFVLRLQRTGQPGQRLTQVTWL